jgi:hypothetical protein
MRHRNRASAWFALVALAAGGAAFAAGPDLLWPVALEPGVASNFCDYRDGRFHAGIDVRTFGREGVPCRAVGDGWVSRVRASSRGYGKALHVTLDSGVQVLYAHLAEFAPELEDTLWAEQLHAGRYGVDFTVPAHRFRFRRGEVVAYSGMTGATAPHLHFEVRSLEDVPLNPLTHGLALPDRDRPTVPRVAFVPLSASAQVEGRCYPLEIEPRRVGNGRYQIDDTLRFGGDVGLAATVVDKLNRRSGNLAPHELQVWSDGSQLTRVVFDGFGFDDVKDVDHALDMGALRARGTDVYTLYQHDGDARERAEFLRGGRIAPAPSTRRVHEGRLVALDAAGNRTQVAFHYMDSLTVETPARKGSIAGARWSESHLAVDLGGSYFHDGFAVVLVYDTRHRLVERRHVDQHDEHVDTVIVRAAELFERTRPLARALADDSATVWLSAIPAAREGKSSFPAVGFDLLYPVGAVYSDAVVFALAEGAARADQQRSLKPRTPAVLLGPAGLVLEHNASVRLRVAQPSPRDGVYRAGANGGPWAFLPTTTDSAGLSASIDRPGVFAVFRDDTAPWLGEARLVVATSYATGDSTYQVHIPVDDEGSGFDDARTEVFVGGSKRIWRWDFVAKKIIVALRGETIIGPLPVRVVAFDRIGNSSSADYTVSTEARASD